MKIAYLSFGHFDVSIPLVRYLSDRVDVDLYIILAHNRKRESVIDLEGHLPTGIIDNQVEVEGSLDKEIMEYLGGRVKIIFVNYFNLKFKNPKNILLSNRLGRYIKSYRYDIIHFDGNDMQQIWISIFTREIPKVHTIHDYIGHTGERVELSEIFNKFLLLSRDQKILHSEKNRVIYSLSKNTVNCIYYGPLEIYRQWADERLIEDEKNLILFFGRISPYKGIEYLIKSVPIIRERIPDLRIIIAGEGRFNFDIEHLRDKKAFEIINRYIPNKELVKLIKQASLVVCPYTDATQSGVVMTAYALNKPVVASAVGGIPEVVIDNVTGRLVPPKDTESLAQAIIELLSNHKKREEMKNNIDRIWSQGKLSWHYIANQTIGVYKKAKKFNSKK